VNDIQVNLGGKFALRSLHCIECHESVDMSRHNES